MLNLEDEVELSEELEKQAQIRPASLVREFVDYFLSNKKWWLAPIVVVLLALGGLLLLSGTAAAPFIYTLF